MKVLYRVTGDYNIDVMVLSSKSKEIIKREVLREVLGYNMPQNLLYDASDFKQERAYHSLVLVEKRMIKI